MTRNLKALGLALLAVFAMSAVVAQGASAVDHTFTAAQAPVDITGNGSTHEFSAQGKTVTCATATFEGTSDQTSEDTLTITPVYDDPCIMEPGEVEVEVKENGCDYLFDSDTTEDPVTGGESAPIEIKCGANPIVIGLEGLCEFRIGSQSNLHGVDYVDNKDGTVTVEAGVHRIKYTASGAFCFLLGISTGTFEGENGATYEGDALVKGYVDGEPHTAENQIDVGLSTP